MKMNHRVLVYAKAAAGQRASDIAKDLGISRQRVSQLLRGADLRSDTRPVRKSKRYPLSEKNWDEKRKQTLQRRVERDRHRKAIRSLKLGFAGQCAIAEGRFGLRSSNEEVYQAGMKLARLYLELVSRLRLND